MQCPQCNAQNHSSRDRCIECGADLFAVPEPTPTILVAVGGVGFAVMGFIDLLIMDSMKDRHSMPVRGSLGIAWLLYQFIGKWPVPIVMWAISAQLLLRARRETVAKRLANAGPQAANPGPRVTANVAPARPAGDPRLHRTLLVSLLVMTALVLTVRYRGIDPGLSPAVTATVGYVCAALGAALLAFALIVARPRIPSLHAGPSVDQYWFATDVAGRMSLAWLLAEGGGTIAAVGYLLTGSVLSEVMLSLAIAALLLSRPGTLARS